MPSKDPDYNRKWREAQKNGKAVIYVILEPETRRVRYVGSSTLNVRERMRLHWSQREQKKTPLANWLKTLSEPPDYEILQEVCKESRWNAEEYWTNLLRQVPSVNLLNLHTASKHDGYPRTEETRKKISIALKGRPKTKPTARGERIGSAKLTEDQVRAIRKAVGSVRAIGREFGVSAETVSNIKRREAWTHVSDDPGSVV